MILRRMLPAVLVLATACGNTDGTRRPEPADGDEERALKDYGEGRFDAAEASVRAILQRDPANFIALRLLGRILLLRGECREAVLVLARGILIQKDDVILHQELLTACYRLDDFASAERQAKILAAPLLAEKYRRLAERVPYVVRWGEEAERLEFTETDPLPAVRLRVNGVAGTFVINTGVSEMILDPDFAQRANVKAVTVKGSPGVPDEGIADDVRMGMLEVRTVPVQFRELQSMGRLKPDGQIGSAFLLHFTFTLDFKHRRLVLRKSGGTSSRVGTEQPFWVAGDRHLLIRGTADGVDLFVQINTGLARIPVAPSYTFLTVLASRGSPGAVKIKDLACGPLSYRNPAQDVKGFPTGLDSIYGILVGVALGYEALKDRTLTFDPSRMKMTVE